VGINVDVHMNRIPNRLKPRRTPKKPGRRIPSQLFRVPSDLCKLNRSWLPAEFHKEMNHLLVGFFPGLSSSALRFFEEENNRLRLFVSRWPQMRHVEHAESLPERSDGREIKGSESQRAQARVWLPQVRHRHRRQFAFPSRNRHQCLPT
jgi:hypothetical protein